MREVSAEALREEILRVRGAVSQTRIYHFSGAKLHDPGSPITSQELQAMKEAGIQSVFFSDQGESEPVAQRALTTQEVDVRNLAVGDVVADTIFGADGEEVCGPGTFVDEVFLSGAVRGAAGSVTIKRRGLRGGPEQASAYLSLIPRYRPHPPRPDTGVLLGAAPAPRAVKPLLAPRAKVLVTVQDDFQRALILNTCAVEGHDAVDRRWADVSQADFQKMTFDAVILDLADAAGALQILRTSDLFRSVAVLVAGPETRRSEIFKAITAGANGSVPMPVKREVLIDRLHSTVQAFGRQIKIKPAVVTDRRALGREGGHMLCALQDKFLKNPLPVAQATLLDLNDAGLRIEYRRPAWPNLHAYLAHGVHPQHFFFHYAKDNPLGRDLSVTLPPVAGRTLEGHAKFVHVSSCGDFEVAGLVLQRMKSSVREHMTAVRGGPVTLKPIDPIRPASTTFRRPF